MSKPMEIPNNKVNLAERDIEDYLYANPSALRFAEKHVFRWTGRQVHVPSGVIDLLGLVADNQYIQGIAVVEVKNVDIDAAALTQVCRYAFDIETLLAAAPSIWTPVWKVIVGPSVSDQRFREAEALDVHAVTFTTSVTAAFSSLSWSSDYLERRATEYETLRNGSAPITALIDFFKPSCAEAESDGEAIADKDESAEDDEGVPTAAGPGEYVPEEA